MYKLPLFLFCLAACNPTLGGGKLVGKVQMDEPFEEEVPHLPLGAVTTKKTIRISNPLDLPVLVVLECNKVSMPEVRIQPHRYVDLEVAVDTEQVTAQACVIAAWDTLQGF